MSKVAIYIRLSVEDMIKTDESESIINQRAYLNDYLDKNEEFKNFTREESVEGPERIKDIGYVLKMVTDKDIIPDEFRELYETFCNTLKIRR